jgi:hypothetical protein
MKKFLIVVLAASICLAFTLPAMAKVTVGGRVALDWSYLDEDAARAAGGVSVGSSTTSNGFKDMNFVVPWTLNRLNVKYTSDDGALSAFIEWRGGGGNDASADAGFLNYTYLTWQITPTMNITFGKQTTNFARFIPQQWVGTHVGTIVGVGFGNVHHGTARTGIKGYHRFSDMIGLVWGLYDADVVAPSGGIALATTSTTLEDPFLDDDDVLVAQENQLPRIDLALPIRFSWGRLEPSVTWSTATYDQFPAGAEDSYDMYGLSLGGTGSWGMFSATAEVTWGRNLGGGSYRGAEGARPVAYLDSSGAIRIADADVLAYLLDVGFKFGPNKIDLYYLSIKYENDGDPALAQTSDGAQYDITQSMYGISWGIGVAKGFTIRPELNFYDYDSSAQLEGETQDLGSSWLLGLQFQLVF